MRHAPPWLASALTQMVLIVLMTLWLLPPPKPEGVHLDFTYADSPGDQLVDDRFRFDVGSPDDISLVTSQNLPQFPDAAPPSLDVTLMGSAPSSPIAAPQIGLALAGRDEGMKRGLISTYGGTAASEAAVKAGLEWLVRQQRKDGSWSLSGPYADGAHGENLTAATAMAMLALQGNGQTHRKGDYQSQVDRALKFLLDQQLPDGSFFKHVPGNSRLYTHGQCTIALCELYGMTRDDSLKTPCERAVEFCVRSQDSLGGWRYVPGSDSDTSVTGWILMALQSARMSRLDVPQSTLDKAGKYLDEARDNKQDDRYGYVPGATASEAMTAEALLCRQYLGWKQSDERLNRGARYLLSPENLPSWDNRNVYYWYYATQMLHHLEGEPWKKWNGVMRDLLIQKQIKSGKERGSWDPLRPTPDRWGAHAGRLYVTCLSIYILEVYYRHLPLYSSVTMR